MSACAATTKQNEPIEFLRKLPLQSRRTGLINIGIFKFGLYDVTGLNRVNTFKNNRSLCFRGNVSF